MLQCHTYLQFLKFQEFQEWQRQQGTSGGTPPPPPEPQQKSQWWKPILGLLRFKLVRRLIYIVVLLVVASMLIDSWFGGSDDASYQPGQPPPAPQPVLQVDPQQATITVYDFVATKPGSVCILLDSPARDAFARNFDAPNCDAAAQRLHGQVTEPGSFKNPSFGENAVQTVGSTAVVRGCQMGVEGGPVLGDFELTRQGDGGWMISGHEAPAGC